ncbi:hypothetical protein A3C20_03645 [Candidatus Kaiserbacteria bacterium RIFCSPHIGHO2_02_FULL_55_25]|uniref:Uncharacterized protein n=1 Tax=Candidatus Kaiserbacteria bacterium RIFCSPHIGHO2_02_FULL_55_25 TaxID=1798498 RepID=A0A1F6EAU7_9BACT|nr:MAG: hypothetical protein A2764_00520 [Candidatus Kaiserbacteria bacterium RIFCSPHIGHO2_01_FULL_55_79]OGG70352.1 MAG: hypothetical protein A3C20_03645 [Candidatus Kaiserbacteria bacterium RIFCSPHIGHO2_02_FULL_55_25]OGG78201.1 MAG: hypothetical protein A3F56_00080 [Candidatus Kaiserbacteria bacterium RIFCSPHIGHO2_12_FULL_55_13]OGG82730.1 MAG: hypothetical protein A3A42_02585 [Candidatus Kaiserbacteria bacterium RIFCSPLOWO2_01_FULL_55_25]
MSRAGRPARKKEEALVGILLWAGQSILTGAWLMMWPVVLWRWTNRTNVPKKYLGYFRTSSVIGGIPVLGLVISKIVGMDLGWFELIILYYLPWGIYATRKARRLSERYAKPQNKSAKAKKSKKKR